MGAWHAAYAGAAKLLSTAERERLRTLPRPPSPEGYDALGMHPDAVTAALALLGPLHRYYFRVRSHHPERIPARGGAILVANHAGTLPIDAAMLWVDVVRHGDPPRVPRPVADLFVQRLPLAGNLLSRLGVVSGARGNVEYLLEQGELLMIFPEGLQALGKPYRERYAIRHWLVGHAQLAIRHGVPVVPVAVIGSEEQWPQVARIRGQLPFGIPYLPVTATPLPLPVRYDIHYGVPIEFGRLYTPEAARSPEAVDQAAQRTRSALEALIEEGLDTRRGVFQ